MIVNVINPIVIHWGSLSLPGSSFLSHFFVMNGVELYALSLSIVVAAQQSFWKMYPRIQAENLILPMHLCTSASLLRCYVLLQCMT